jgi:thiamine kinase-like enzyme
MRASPFQLPDSQTLEQSFKAILRSHRAPGDQITILGREPNSRTSTYPSEVVTCLLADGSEERFLCKYAAGNNHNAFGHRGGLEYEAAVYRHVLQPLPVSTPAYYGLHKDETTGQTWLVLQYMDKSVQVRDAHDRTLIYAAAHWLARFHGASESRLSLASLPCLHRYDADYYLGWAVRTSNLAGPLHQRFPWLATLCERFEDVVETLLGPPAMIIHGEYYPNNILFRQGAIYPVDWESAAIAIGEIDFASLIERWPAKVVERCKAEYLSVRWPKGTPTGFEQRLDVAQLYWRFRWLGERSDWTTEEKSRWRFDQLRSIGERLDLI